jgi:hypothetical protein
MANAEITSTGGGDAPVSSLSGFECRCLIRRLGDCRAVVERTISGVDSARSRAPWIDEVQAALLAAEREIQRAERLAALGDGVVAACHGFPQSVGLRA